MADLGTKVVAVGEGKRGFTVADWPSGASTLKQAVLNMGVKARDIGLQASAAAGTFSGTVKEGGVAVPNCVVRVYERSTGAFVVEVRTDSGGAFTIPYMRQGSSDYYVIALDPDGGALYNGLIFDRVAPV